VGLAGGAMVGADASRATSGSAQQRYDHAFTQCMYARGHKVPVAGRHASYASRGTSSNTLAARTPPPPPPPGKPPAEVPPDYKQR
jgi:hypothetical protein